MKRGINYTETHGQLAQFIADQIDIPCGDKLSYLTTEELFYVKKLMEYKFGVNSKNQFLLTMQMRFKDWLKNSRIHCPLPFEKLSKWWRYEFHELSQEDFA